MERHIERFVNYLKIEKNAADHTITNYTHDLKSFEEFLGERDMLSADHLTFRRFLAEMRSKNYAKRTVARKLAALRTFFKFLYREGLIKSNPITAISTPKLDKRLPVFLDVDKVVKLIKSVDVSDVRGARDRAMLEVLY